MSPRPRLQLEAARTGVGQGHQVQHPDPEFFSHRHRGRLAVFFHDQGLGVQVGQVELKLIGAVGRVQRSAGHAASASGKTRGHLGPVGQHDGDPVVATYALGVEKGQRVVHQATQALEVECAAAGCSKRWGMVGAGGQQVDQGRRGHGVAS
jgi:hypothetical protein